MKKYWLIDISSERRKDLIIPIGEKVACIAACKCKELDGEYLVGLGLYDGTVQIWKIQVQQWKYHKLLQLILHEQKQPIKDICFIDEYHIVSGGLDKTIKLLNFNQDGQPVGDPMELKMTLQCRGMKIEGVIREKEKKKLQELIKKTL